jgi:hypothetical protein
MSLQQFNPRTLVLLLFILVVAALRLASYSGWGPLTVFTPVGAMALFGGAYFTGNVKPYAFPLLTLFISDFIMSYTLFAEYRHGFLYSGWMFTYAAYALMALAGKLIIKNITVVNIAIATVAATLIHWLVSDIGGCIPNGSFSFTVYVERLITAIPYELRFLSGTAVYSAIMFGGFELLQRRYTALQPAH